MLAKKTKIYIKLNRDKINKARVISRKKYIVSSLKRERKYASENRDKINTRNKKRRKASPMVALSERVRGRLQKAFARKGYKKESKTEKLLGVSFEIVKLHIEKHFLEGMNWENRAEWHIDHKIPLSSAKTEQELIKLCHYTNLQPLWKFDNLSKGSKILPIQASLLV